MRLVLIRGLPGSGKSTMASKMVGFVHVEADQYFTDADGHYNFRPEGLAAAHGACLRAAKEALADGRDVVVSNTFTRRWEMQPYFDAAKEYGAEVEIITAAGSWPNVHGVPAAAISKMRERWEAA